MKQIEQFHWQAHEGVAPLPRFRDAGGSTAPPQNFSRFEN
jgi:hypothetical protein